MAVSVFRPMDITVEIEQLWTEAQRARKALDEGIGRRAPENELDSLRDAYRRRLRPWWELIAKHYKLGPT